MAFEVKKPFNKDAHFAALKAAAQQSKSEEAKPLSDSKELARAKELPKPEDCSERIRIVFDDSGSMIGEKMDNAKAGVVEFLRNCIPGATAVAIHLLNSSSGEDKDGWADYRALPPVISNSTLSSDLILIASAADSKELRATGGTPLEPRLLEALQATPRASRIVAFSDGQPDSKARTQQIINLSKEYQIPIDTVYLDARNENSWAYDDNSAMSYMKELAEATGGIFLHFKKGSSFKTSFKYLAPVKRLMLMDSAFKARVERGEV